MGNRAVIIAGSEIGKRHVVGIYVHWFSKQSAEDAVRECEANGCRSPDEDAPYGMARICESLCRRNPGGLNIGLVAVDLEEVRRDGSTSAMWLFSTEGSTESFRRTGISHWFQWTTID